MHYIQDDSLGKINIFGCDFIGHCGENFQWTFLLTMHYIQGDTLGKSNIFGCDCIGHCVEKVQWTFLLHNALYTGLFTRKNQYFWMWLYRSLCGKKFNELFSSQCIIYRVIEEEKICFWKWLYRILCEKSLVKSSPHNALHTGWLWRNKSMFWYVIAPIPKISLTINNSETFFIMTLKIASQNIDISS
jgi:hypothetical protein